MGNWQAFGAENHQSALLPTAGGDACVQTMRSICQAEFRAQPRMTGNVPGEQGIASFLIARGPYWWMGWGFAGCDIYHPYDPLWDIDPGEPLSNCTEETPGIFSRSFQKGSAKLDCNQWTAELNFESLIRVLV